MKIKELLPEKVKELLSEDSMSALQDKIKSKIDLAVESALTQQDELYSSKLVELMEATDLDRAAKMHKALMKQKSEATSKIKRVIEKYENDLNNEASKFRTTLVESISSYLDEFLDEAIPAESIAEATHNKTASNILDNLRKALAVDTMLMKESVKDAFLDGKEQIDQLQLQVDALLESNKKIRRNYNKSKALLMLEHKTKSLQPHQRDYMLKVLGDKDPAFISENFDYTLRLFEKEERKERKVLKEQAFKQRVVRDEPKRTPSRRPVKETYQSPADAYLEGLDKMK